MIFTEIPSPFKFAARGAKFIIYSSYFGRLAISAPEKKLARPNEFRFFSEYVHEILERFGEIAHKRARKFRGSELLFTFKEVPLDDLKFLAREDSSLAT